VSTLDEIKTLIGFWYKRKLKSRPLIQLSEMLLLNQDTNQFFSVDRNWTSNLLFNYQRLYQLS